MNKINRIFWLYQRYVSKRPIRILCRIKYYSVCQFAPFGLESHQSKRRFLEYNLPEMSAENSPFPQAIGFAKALYNFTTLSIAYVNTGLRWHLFWTAKTNHVWVVYLELAVLLKLSRFVCYVIHSLLQRNEIFNKLNNDAESYFVKNRLSKLHELCTISTFSEKGQIELQITFNIWIDENKMIRGILYNVVWIQAFTIC